LTETVTFRLGFGSVKLLLENTPPFLSDMQGIVHLQSKLREIVDTVFPDPINTFSGFVPQIAAVEVPAQE